MCNTFYYTDVKGKEMLPLGQTFWGQRLWSVFICARALESADLHTKLKREMSRTAVGLKCRAPAALQSTLEFLQEHTCTLRSVMFVMGGFPESVTMMGSW